MSENEQGKKEEPRRSLKDAVRRARLSEAERSDVIVELRGAERARLELLHEELVPVFEDLPEADQFECALVPGDPPRLWIDMLAYVMMGPDKRTYRFVKDTRHGRQVMQETPEVSEMADSVTDYIAHRVIERERALESDESAPARIPVVGAARRGSRALAVILAFLFGLVTGAFVLFVVGALLAAP